MVQKRAARRVPAIFSHLAQPRFVAQNFDRIPRHGVHVADVAEEPALAVLDHLRYAADVRGDGDHLRRHRFQSYQSKRFQFARQQQNIRRCPAFRKPAPACQERSRRRECLSVPPATPPETVPARRPSAAAWPESFFARGRKSQSHRSTRFTGRKFEICTRMRSPLGAYSARCFGQVHLPLPGSTRRNSRSCRSPRIGFLTPNSRTVRSRRYSEIAVTPSLCSMEKRVIGK